MTQTLLYSDILLLKGHVENRHSAYAVHTNTYIRRTYKINIIEHTITRHTF